MSQPVPAGVCSPGDCSRVSGANIQPIVATTRMAPLIPNAHP